MGTGSAPRPRHVVHVTETFGGVETYLRLLLAYWQDPDVRFSFVLGADGPFAEDLRAEGYAVEIVPMPRSTTQLGALRARGPLRRALKRLDPDVVHLHSSQAGFVGRLAWRRTPMYYTPHAFFYLGQSGLKRWIFLTAERVLGRLNKAAVLATSPSEWDRAVGDVGLPLDRAVTVLNGVESAAVEPRVGTQEVFRVGIAARVAPQKDLGTFLEAVAELRRRRRADFAFDLVGVGHYDGDGAVLAGALAYAGVAPEDVGIHPWMPREDLLAWLETCDAIVLTSKFESFGYLLAEATARGVPVVGTDVDGIRDIIQHGRTGLLVPPRDPHAVARALEWLAATPEYPELSARALADARARLGVERVVRQLALLYHAAGGGQALAGADLTPAGPGRQHARG